MKRTALKRSTKPIQRSELKRGTKPIPRRRAKPRKGRVVHKKRWEFVKSQPCFVTGERPATVHHVRRFGEPKSDLRIVPLVARLHMRGDEIPGQPCVERGKKIFEEFWRVDLEAAVVHFYELFDKLHQ
jgi:hypothetical protein